jgi:hypothetical protein
MRIKPVTLRSVVMFALRTNTNLMMMFQLEVVQHRFEVTVSSMLTELDLLRKHRNMLLEQLQVLEENKPQP